MQIINRIWPEWKVEKEIGQGSYGTVYKCVNETKEYCAMKVISIPQNEHEMSEVISEKMSVEQSREYYKDIADDLIKEIEILKALKGTKNIVEIYDAQIIEKEDGIGWNILIRMELLTDFNTYISDKQLSEKDVIKLGADLGNALSVCHKAKIIHRDIKPENILVDDEGNFKLGDFGVAKQMEKTQGSMSVKGTYNYMSPEVFAGKKCDGRADLYSLALVMYKLLNNNRLPFIDPNKQIVRYSERQTAFEKRINGEELPPIQGISNELNAVILKACAFKPNDRQKDIDELNKELGYLLEGKRIINKKLLKRIAIAVAVVVLLVSATVSIYHFSKYNVKEVELESLRLLEDVEMKSEPSDSSDSVGTLKSGDIVVRDAISDDGWSRILDEDENEFFIPTEKLESISNTDTSGLCGDRLAWEYNKETRELKFTGKGDMYWCNQGEYPWSQYSTSIKKVTISKGITEVSPYAFFNFDSLKSIIIPVGVVCIGSYAFSESESLTDIIIPDSVTTIQDDAFSRCRNLKSITLPDSVEFIGQGAFCECDCLESITIPYGVTEIYDYTFYLCYSLKDVTIPNSVINIGKYAFSCCYSLADLVIPDSVSTIGDYAFENCTSLSSVVIPDSVVSLGSFAFYCCYSMTEVKLLAGLTRINSGSFSGCNALQTITVGSELTDVGANAFYDCYNLTEVYYTGNKQQWNNISIESGNDYLTQCEVVYNA